MVSISITQEQFHAIDAHLKGKRTEQVAFIFLSQDDTERFSVRSYYLVPTEELIHESAFHAEVSEIAQAKVIKMAWDQKLCLGEIHSHPKSMKNAQFSASDLSGFEEFVPHVWWRLKKRPYFALVFSLTDFDALAWLSQPNHAAVLANLSVNGKASVPTGLTARALEAERKERERYSRQEAFFGKAGQEQLAALKIAIVGLGGLGSHIAQQLAYLGVKHYALIDHDQVDRSNLNRLIGANEADIGTKKTEIAERLIKTVQPQARTQKIGEGLRSQQAFEAIERSDFVFGCVDNDGVRLILLELCCAHQRPYLDLATDSPDAASFGGRAVFTGLGKGCPKCLNELDADEIDLYFSSPAQRAEKARIYGVSEAALEATGPSVVFLNGLVASMGVCEFASFVTGGIRPPFPYLVYRGEMGVVTRPPHKKEGTCYYCDLIWSGREKVDARRYISDDDI